MSDLWKALTVNVGRGFAILSPRIFQATRKNQALPILSTHRPGRSATLFRWITSFFLLLPALYSPRAALQSR